MFDEALRSGGFVCFSMAVEGFFEYGRMVPDPERVNAPGTTKIEAPSRSSTWRQFSEAKKTNQYTLSKIADSKTATELYTLIKHSI